MDRAVKLFLNFDCLVEIRPDSAEGSSFFHSRSEGQLGMLIHLFYDEFQEKNCSEKISFAMEITLWHLYLETKKLSKLNLI